jgi:multiple sugar transport system permease protein
LALHLLLVWLPAIATGILSVMEWDNLTALRKAKPVGFRNYWQIFTIFDPKLFPALFNNLILIFWLTLCSVIGMFFAYLLDKNVRGTRIYQSVFYMPVVLSFAIVGFIWKAVMFQTDRGLLNKIIPGKGIDFLGDDSFVFSFHVPFLDFPLGLHRNFAAICIASAWRHIGYVMVLYLAGLKGVDPSLREAAAIDGATEVTSFRHVLFPVLRPINSVVAVITVIEALRAYDIVAALGNQRGTEVGLGSAYGMVLFVLCIGFIIKYVINNFRNEAV